MSYSVLAVDDEELTLRTVSRGLRAEGFEVLTAPSGEEALTVFAEEKPDLTLLDIVLPGIDGVEVLRRMKQANPAAIILMMSAYPMVDRAVEAMKLGAFDYLIKPFHPADMIATLHRASEMLALRVRVRDDVEQARGRYDFGKVVTKNEATRRMLEVARKAAESEHTTILLQGESGTGKSVFAKAICQPGFCHAAAGTELRCPSGYASGKRALRLRARRIYRRPSSQGRFARTRPWRNSVSRRDCHHVGQRAGETAARARRKHVHTPGGTRPIKITVRLIAATNADLKEAIARGQFREELYYRLNVVPLYIPPLRERREDIVPLALELLQHFNRELRKKFTGFTPAAAELLQSYPWPGNIRELKNVIERTMILVPEGDIDAAALPEEIRDHVRSIRRDEPRDGDSSGDLDVSPTGRQLVTLRELEDEYVQEVLAATGNNNTQASRILGIHPTSLLRRLKKEHAD